MQQRATVTAQPARTTSMIERVTRRIVAVWTGLARRIAEGLSREALNRRVLYRLSVLSDRELGDIGLSRYDVMDAASLGTGNDATHFLMRRRDDRQNARHTRYPL